MKKSPLILIPHRYRRWIFAASFAIGVLFDVLTLGRIDSFRNLAKLSVCLAFVSALLVLELSDITDAAIAARSRWLARAWPYREAATHFLLGVLLSAYTFSISRARRF